ncbi:neuroglobin-like isoform X2 [Littorina saxatilis]
MGCGSSKAVVAEEPALNITDEIKASVRESWALFLQANEDSQQNYGMFIFVKLFAVAPEAYSLFEFVEGLSHEDLVDNEKLGWHVKKVTEAISAVVINLDDMDSVVKMLVDLGGRHSAYGIKEEYFVAIKEAVVYALEKALKDKFTEEHRKSWTIVMEVVVHLMIQGLLSNSMEEQSTVI